MPRSRLAKKLPIVSDSASSEMSLRRSEKKYEIAEACFSVSSLNWVSALPCSRCIDVKLPQKTAPAYVTKMSSVMMLFL